MNTLLHDLRYGVRMLTRNPGYSVISMTVLALGIGATTVIFSILSAVLLHPLPYQEADRLVRIWGTSTQSDKPGEPLQTVSPLDVVDWREQSRSFDDIGMYTLGSTTLTGAGEPIWLTTGVASPGLFQTLGVQPALGRWFLPEEAEVGKHRVALLSHGLWKRQFGANPDVVGSTITLAGNAFTVVGVMPNGFSQPLAGAPEPDLWRPLAITPDPGARGGHFVMAFGRLKPGVSVEAAQRELADVAARLEAQYPATNDGWGVSVQPLHESMVGDTRPTLLMLFAAVACLLLIACANVAGLQLARATARGRELALRMAIGASRARVLRQWLTESILLAALGGTFGLVLALWVTGTVASLGASWLPRADRIAVDGFALAFAVGAVVVSGAMSGLIPALHASRLDPQAALKEGSGTTPGSGTTRSRQMLVASEVALSVVLLVTAGLLARSLWEISNVDPGFATEGVLTMNLSLPPARYPEGRQARAFYDGLVERIGGLAGVRSVGAVNILPLTGSNSCDGFVMRDRPAPPPGQELCAENRVAAGDYFGAMGISVREGRAFTASDTAEAQAVAVVNEAFVERYYAGQSPLGREVKFGLYEDDQPWRTVVGLVGSVKHFGLDAEAKPEIYTPHAQTPMQNMIVTVRTAGEPTALTAAARREVAEMDSLLAIATVRTTRDLVRNSVARPRLRAVVVGTFAVTALVLAAVGILGTIAYTVAMRTREIGVRMALGAERGDIVGLVVRQGMAPVLLGLVVGLGASAVVGQMVSGLLFGVGSGDAATFLAVPAILAVVALFACYIPARRASRIDPIAALRCE